MKLQNEVCPICKQPFGLYLEEIEPKCTCISEGKAQVEGTYLHCPKHGLSTRAEELRNNSTRLVGSYLDSVFLQCPNAPREHPHFVLTDGVSSDGYTLERVIEALIVFNQEHEKEQRKG